MYWQANANTPLSVTALLNVPYTLTVDNIFQPMGITDGSLSRRSHVLEQGSLH